MNDLSNRRDNITKIVTKETEHILYSSTKRSYLKFDERYLYEYWENRFSSGCKFYLLHDLSPKLANWNHINESSLQHLKLGVLFILATVIVFFSDYDDKLPLLSPALLILGLIPIVRGLLDIAPKVWTYISDDDGTYVTSIQISRNETDKQKQKREIFEKKLSQAIETAKQKEYYDLE